MAVIKRNLITVFIILTVYTAHASYLNYAEYFALTNKAEMKIIDSAYADALNLYEQAFSKVSYSNIDDMYNAAVCAYLIHDYDRAITYAKSCAMKGGDLAMFQICWFSEMHLNKNWIDLMKSKEALKDKHYQSIDLVLRRKIDLLVAKDQKVRLDNSQRTEEVKDAIRKVDKENFSELMWIFEEYGIPGEEQIGSDSGISPYFCVLWHNYYDFSENFIQRLKAAVIDGKFNRYDYTRLITNKTSMNTTYGSTAFHRVDNVLYVENFAKEQIQAIDANRMELGLESFEELKKKVLFLQNDNRFKFRTGAILGWDFANPEDKAKFLKEVTRLN